MRARKAVAGFVAMLLAVTGLVVISSSPAQAAVSCYIVCDGQDPNTAVYEDSYGNLRPCDKRTIWHHDFGQGRWMELRYSYNCRMVWGRGDVNTGFSVEGWNSNGTAMRVSYEKPGRGTYTPAVNDAGLLARVCTWYLYFCSPMW